MPSHLFIYGTLHPDRAPREIAEAARRLIPIGSATIRARIYNLGPYPGAILDDAAPPVAGTLFRVPDTVTLAQLDAYEDYRPADPINSLSSSASKPSPPHPTASVTPAGSTSTTAKYKTRVPGSEIRPSTQPHRLHRLLPPRPNRTHLQHDHIPLRRRHHQAKLFAQQFEQRLLVVVAPHLEVEASRQVRLVHQ